jgi:hypothetical protein
MHFMPWEIDYAAETFAQLRRSNYFLPSDFEINVKSVLNLSEHLIEWGESKIPKDFFVQKYNTFAKSLDVYQNVCEIYDGAENYGHLDWQRKVYADDSDYYLNICSDIYFSEHLLGYMLQATQTINNKYFLLTPQICTLWDSSWDVLVNGDIGTLPYSEWHIKREISDIDYFLHTNQQPTFVRESQMLKWAGWFDLTNKGFIETLGSVPEDWNGYGAWDLYTMIVSDNARRKGYDFQQYILDGQIIFPREVGVFVESGGYTKYYRDFLVHKDLSEQRDSFNQKMNQSLHRKLSEL